MPRTLIPALASRFGRRMSIIERREFLRETLAASAGLLLSARNSAGLGREQREIGKHIVVIGAGLAGLACAHELLAVGYRVTVLEARNRVGGRVLSANANNGREFVKGRNVEFGAELIGSNHAAWVSYAERFKLEFLDVTNDESAELPVVIGGEKLSGKQAEELWEGLEQGLSQLNDLARPVLEDEPWKTPQAVKLDKTSIQTWIDELDASPRVKRAVWINQTADNGQDASRQSLLGQLASVKGGGLENYWTESEVYRCRGGNDQLATKLAQAIGNERINTSTPVKSISRNAERMSVTTSDGKSIECDDVVLTAPPRTWHKVSFVPPLPKEMNPQTGLNAKYFAVVKNRFWEEHDPKLNQYALSDGPVQMTWDGTDNQGPIEEGIGGACLVGFAGGTSCEKVLDLEREARDRLLGETFEQFFPGYSENLVKSFYMNWPQEAWSGAGYSFPAPGQVTTVGPLMASAHMNGRLHIAGEHACYKFVGYMEGALQSGLRVAKAIATRDGAIG